MNKLQFYALNVMSTFVAILTIVSFLYNRDASSLQTKIIGLRQDEQKISTAKRFKEQVIREMGTFILQGSDSEMRGLLQKYKLVGERKPEDKENKKK